MLQRVMSQIAAVKKDMIILEKSEFSALLAENEVNYFRKIHTLRLHCKNHGRRNELKLYICHRNSRSSYYNSGSTWL